MKKRKSVAIIFGSILILGLLFKTACSTIATNGQQPYVQSAQNVAILDNDPRSDTEFEIDSGSNYTFSNTRQQPQESLQPACSTPNMASPDHGTISDTISIPDTDPVNELVDLDVRLNILHTYVGDLTITLDHLGESATVIDRLGCGGSNISVIVNDESNDGDIVSQCDDAPAIHGNRVGGNPAGPVLSTFYGDDYSSDWVLTIHDNGRGDRGTLVEWCLMPTVKEISVQGCYELTLSHTGQGSNPVALPANSANCSVDHHYVAGESISLNEATPDSGWRISSWSGTDNDTSMADTNTVTMPDRALTASVNYVESDECKPETFTFKGSDPLSGTAGSIKTITVNGFNVKVTGWSRDKATGAYVPAYVGLYSGGLGVTDLVSDGSGSNYEHTVDNNGADNYLLFEFDRPVVSDQIYLGYVKTDTDATLWFGNAPGGVDPYTSHQTLDEALLVSLTSEDNPGNGSVRWVDFNENSQPGNILVVAAKIDDSDDHFKVQKLTFTCSP